MLDVPLRITVLGSATPFARPGNACSGYLVEGGGARVWVDAGSGTLAELQRYVALGDVDAVWISHLHADHSADLLTTHYALLYAGLDLPLPVPLFGPAASPTGSPGSSPTAPSAAPWKRPSPSRSCTTGMSSGSVG